MNKNNYLHKPQSVSLNTFLSVPEGNSWTIWITGKALPLGVWIFFLLAVLLSVVADAQRMLHEGASLESLLVLARRGLTGAFMVLLATAYLTRIHATKKAHGFLERISHAGSCHTDQSR